MYLVRINCLVALFCSCFHLCCGWVVAKTITGKAVHVSDGDTIRIKYRSGKKVEIRLYGIDTPEIGQPFGNAAKRHLSRLVYNKKVSVKVYDTDRYGRTVGVVQLGNTNITPAKRVGLAVQQVLS